MLKRIQIILSLFSLSVCLLIHDRIAAQNFDFSFEHLTVDQGLSSDQVTSIVKDQSGFMWFATLTGLNRYDGEKFKIYKSTKGDGDGLISNHISSLSIDTIGWIWISTPKGIVRFKPEDDHFEILRLEGVDIRGDHITSNVAFTRKGEAWFIIDDMLYKLAQDKKILKKIRLPIQEIAFSVFIDKKDRIWINARSAIYSFDEQKVEFKYYGGMDISHPNQNITIGQMVPSSSDTTFFASYGSGLLYYDEKKDNLLKWKTANEMLIMATEDFDEDGHRFFWCTGGALGLMVYDPTADKYHYYENNPRDPFSHNGTESTLIYKDTSNGSVWIATNAGVEKYDPYSLRFKRKYLPSDYSFSSFLMLGEVVKDQTDPTGKTYWIGTWAAGIFKWNRETNEFKRFTMKDGLLHHEVFHVVQSAKTGNLIIACRDGIQIFDPRTEKFIKQIKGFFWWPFNKKVLYVMEADNGDLWFCANYDGLYQYDSKANKVKHWDIPTVMPEKGPYLSSGVYQDQQHRIWVAGFNGDIQIIEPEKGTLKNISNADRKKSRLPGKVQRIYINKKGDVWVSGAGNYVAQLDQDGEVVKIFSDPTADETATSGLMIQDPLGYIWLCTDNKVQRIDTRSGKRISFTKQDGLIYNNEVNGMSIMDDGELFLGFQYSVSYINTYRVRFNSKPPKIKISEMFVDEAQRFITDADKMVFQPSERNISLEFAALNFSQPTKNNYAFFLEGYDTAWFYSGNKRQLTLMNLDGATYKLRVKASNNDGVWSDEKIIEIKIIPPFVETWTFKILIAAAIAGVGFLIYWYKKQQRIGLEKIRNRIATDLHDDMGSTLSSIRIFSDVAKKQVEPDKPEVVPLLDRIGNNAAALSENMQDIIWAIRTDNDKLEDLVARMREFALKVCEARNIVFEAHVSDNFKMSKLNLEQRRNLYLIFKETINNAVKYSDCNQIHLFMTQQGNYLKMAVRDNGKGFDFATVRKGNGLNNLQKRAREIGGNLGLESAPGSGTRIELLVKLRPLPGL